MPYISVDNVYLQGVNKDVDPIELPPEAWTTALNARMTLNGIQNVKKHSLGMAPIAVEDARAVFYFGHNDVDYWITCNNTKVAADEGGNYDLFLNTFTTPTPGNLLGWNGTNYHGIQLLNNGIDYPVYWTGASKSITLPDIVAWPKAQAAAGGGNLIDARAKVIRSFLNFIIALNITDVTPAPDERYDRRVIWSHSASPGNMPDSWDYTDDEKLAGHKDLTDTNGAIVDGLPMGNLFFIYKEDSLWAMNFIGAPEVFDFIKISDNIQLFAPNCVVETPVGHALLANGDFMVHSGDGTYQSPLTRRYRNSLFSEIDHDSRDRCFLVRQPLHNEVWICYPELGQIKCTMALVWNWQTNAVYNRTLEGFYDGVFGLQVPPEAVNLWSDETALAWGDDSHVWDAQYEELTRESLVMVGAVDESVETGTADTSFLRLMDVFDGTVLTDDTILERHDLAIAGTKRDGSPRTDRKVRKLVTELIPRLEISGTGVTITISVGGRNNTHDNIVYDCVEVFDPRTADRIFTLVNYPFIAVKFHFSFTLGQNAVVNFYGYDMKVELAGQQ